MVEEHLLLEKHSACHLSCTVWLLIYNIHVGCVVSEWGFSALRMRELILLPHFAFLLQVGALSGQPLSQVRVQQVTAARGQQPGTVQVQRIPTGQVQGGTTVNPLPTVKQQLQQQQLQQQQQVKRVPQTLSIQQQPKPVTIIPQGTICSNTEKPCLN